MAVRPNDEYPERTTREAPVQTTPPPYEEPRVIEERPIAPGERRVVVESSRTAEFGGLFVVRLLLTLAGAAAMIVGAFGTWTATRAGTTLTDRAFVQTRFDQAAFLLSAGTVFIALGLIAIVGVSFRSGWLTRIAGALGIVGFVLFVIELYRMAGPLPSDAIGWGAWLALAGSIVALIGGFFTTRTVTTTVPAATA